MFRADSFFKTPIRIMNNAIIVKKHSGRIDRNSASVDVYIKAALLVLILCKMEQ